MIIPNKGGDQIIVISKYSLTATSSYEYNISLNNVELETVHCIK